MATPAVRCASAANWIMGVGALADQDMRQVVVTEEGVVLRDMNFLHLNHPKGMWTWVADVYAVLLLLMAVTGMFVLKGRQGLAGRGKWFILGGLIVPLGFIALRYLN